MPLHGDPWTVVHRIFLNLFVNFWLKPTAGLDNMYLGTGCRLMASLTACHTRSPAEDLQPTPFRHLAIMHIEQGRGSHHHDIWGLGMYSMVDTEGPVEIGNAKEIGGETGK